MTRHHSSYPYPVPGRLFRGGEFLRLMSMIVMLFVLFTMITRLRNNPNMLAWLVNERSEDTQIMRHAPPPEQAEKAAVPAANEPAQKPAEKPPEQKPPEKPPAMPAEEPAANAAPALSDSSSAPDSAAKSEPPLDQDPEEQEAFKEEVQAFNDGRMAREVIDMGAYLRLVRWARSLSWSQMLAQAGKGFVYTDFVQSPDRFRGKLLTMKLDARRIIACPEITDPDDPAKKLTLYEVWGFTKESRSFPYAFVVLDLPEGMPFGPEVQENVRVAGYFLGLQGYMSSYSKPGSAPLRAPLFIGRLEWIKPQPVQLNSTDWNLIWGAGGVALLIVVGTLGYLAFRSRGGPPRLAGDRVEPRKMTMEEWLDQAESGQAAVDVGPDDDLEDAFSPKAVAQGPVGSETAANDASHN